MDRLRLIVAIGAFCATLFPRSSLAWDRYDDSQSHPLRVVAYLTHPVGVLVELAFARPFHFLVSTPGLEYLFGHRPHPPIFKEPQIGHDYGVSRRVYLREAPTGVAPLALRVRRFEPTAERVAERVEGVAERVVVKEVVVEKPVIREVPQVVEVERVLFPDIAFLFNSSELTDLGKGKAYLVAQRLKEKADVVVVIEGHTDDIGTDAYNQRLGFLRAERIKQELAGLGIDPARMSVVTSGESKPLIEQPTPWARAVNRRVEFKVAGP